MERGRGPLLALLVVAMAARLVHRRARERWRREWEGEILARWEELETRGALTRRARADILVRAAGSLIDALHYGNGRWRMAGFGQDVAVAVRTLARKPGLTLVVVPTLALGIGASTAMFTVARDVLLRPFPYPDPDRVVAVQDFAAGGGGAGNVTYPNIADLAEATTSFEAIGVTRWWSPALEDEGGSIVVRGATVTANYFDVLGVDAGLGRFFRSDEEGTGREPLVVLAHGFWRDRFGADPTVVGRELRLSGETYRVVGITGAAFEDPWMMGGPGLEPQVFRTVDSPPSEWPRSGRSWMGIGRIRADVSLETARSELDAAFAGLAEAYPEANRNRSVRLVPLRDRIAGPARPTLVTLLASVGILLLIACANLANLLLGRALDRQREFAVHKALGAAGWRLFNRSLAEAAVLSVVGGAAGLGLAWWLVGLAAGVGSRLPRPVTGDVDLGILAFAAMVTVGAGLLFGLGPALHAARAGAASPGRDGGRGNSHGRGTQRLRRALVVGELALTTSLLIGAGLMVRSFHRLGGVDLGLRAEGVVTVQLHGSAWWDLAPDAAQAQWDAVMEAVRAVPGVESAGAMDYVPLGGDYSCDGVAREDLPPPGPGEGMCAETRMVLPGAVATLGVPLVRGRLLEPTDRADRPHVALIDQNFADALWPGVDPLGKRFRVHTNVHEVVGIVGNMLHFGPGEVTRPQLYLHAPQDGWNGIQRGLTVLARGSDPGALVAPIRAAVAEVNPSIAIGTVETLDGYLRQTLAPNRFRTGLMVAFGATALLLALLGIAGVMNYSVTRRTREMGVRLALGAEPTEVRGLVLREGLRMGAVGMILGVIVAVVLAGRLEALLFEVGSRDPWVYGSVVALLGLATATACYVPAGRASRVDPVVALASE
ncbi:MAG TPA: ABC transporter permease [Longimicrobiales bacterium]